MDGILRPLQRGDSRLARTVGRGIEVDRELLDLARQHRAVAARQRCEPLGRAIDQAKAILARDPRRELRGAARVGDVAGMRHRCGRSEHQLEQPSGALERAAHRDHRVAGHLGVEQQPYCLGRIVVDPADADIACAAEQRERGRFFGDSPAIATLRQTIAKVARSQAPVYIAGESGVGKELTARTIHEQGPRANGPFVPVNCGAIPAELMESEFFGHKKGSFTGAHADKPGLFQTADGGTLFLDEIAELPLAMQVKLLRAIQEKSVRPVGANNEVPVDVRILSATHKDLGALVADGRFRQDLYYRINVIELRVPPLRERRDDLPGLADAILRRLATAQGRPVPSLSDEATDALQAYPFPGNVRELENILERAVALCEGHRIEVADLYLPQVDSLIGQETDVPLRTTTTAIPQTGAGLAAGDTTALPDAIEQMERDTIQKALEANRYNKTKTAAQLGITFRALRYKLKKLGME